MNKSIPKFKNIIKSALCLGSLGYIASNEDLRRR